MCHSEQSEESGFLLPSAVNERGIPRARVSLAGRGICQLGDAFANETGAMPRSESKRRGQSREIPELEIYEHKIVQKKVLFLTIDA